MKVGFTGTRKGMTERQKDQLDYWFEQNYDSYEDSPKFLNEFHHGDCQGADEQAHEFAKFYFRKIVVHPPLEPRWRAYTIDDLQAMYDSKYFELRPEKGYIERNHDIVDETDILIAAPEFKEEQLRSGTWATIRYARRRDKPVIILEP